MTDTFVARFTALARKLFPAMAALVLVLLATAANASEADLIIPDLAKVSFLGVNGHNLLLWGLLICVLGIAFSLVQFSQIRKLPVHKSMLEISELISETCKTYLIQQGKFLAILWVFIAAIMVWYFSREMDSFKVGVIVVFSIIGILGSYSVAWFGIRMNTFANSRTAFAGLKGKPYPTLEIPLKAGMSIGMLLIAVELVLMLIILLFVPGDMAGPCFIGFATYGVTGVALITFILLAVGHKLDPGAKENIQIQLLVWIFVMRIGMIVTSAVSYGINGVYNRGKYGESAKFNFEHPLTSLVWLTSFVSIAMTYLLSYLLIPTLGDGTLWWKLSTIITCGTLAGAIIPELVKIFTSTNSGHVREIVTASREGGASLNILSGLVAGNFSAYWLGLTIVALMGIGFLVSTQGFGDLMIAPCLLYTSPSPRDGLLS